MRHVIIASHAGFAGGLADTLRFVAGEAAAEIETVNAYTNCPDPEKRFAELFDRFSGEEVLVLTDMMQGSVNQLVVPHMREGVFVVTGVNVPCALELMLMPSPLTNEAVDAAVESARTALLRVETPCLDVEDEDE